MGGRLSSRWQRWMLNDLTGPGWRRRMIQSQFILVTISLGLGFIAFNATRPHPSSVKFADWAYPTLVLLGAVVVSQTLMTAWRARKLRNRWLAQHFMDQPSRNDPLPPLPLS